MIAGLKPRGFTWVIADRLAVSERIGGNGFQHRKVRREEEITWLVNEAGITGVVSLLPGNQNVQSYRAAGLTVRSVPTSIPPTPAEITAVHEAVTEELAPAGTRILLHRETIDDSLAGLLGGYLIAGRLVEDPILATAVIQEILGRALGPQGRAVMARATSIP